MAIFLYSSNRFAVEYRSPVRGQVSSDRSLGTPIQNIRKLLATENSIRRLLFRLSNAAPALLATIAP
jgi:hypothetical protein